MSLEYHGLGFVGREMFVGGEAAAIGNDCWTGEPEARDAAGWSARKRRRVVDADASPFGFLDLARKGFCGTIPVPSEFARCPPLTCPFV